MTDTDQIFEFAEALVYQNSRTHCSDLQRTILMTVLRGERKTYEQIAEECGYSAKYVKQDVAPKLWNVLSAVIGQKVSKSNARNLLEQEYRKHLAAKGTTSQPPTSSTSPLAQNKPAAPAGQSAAASLPTSVLHQVPGQPKAYISSLSKKSTILLVDDQPKNLRLLSDVLEEEGYEVQQAINGTVALEAVAIAPPDLILLDIHMPELDGYTVCQQLKTMPQTQNIPVIFVSALDEAWDKVKAFSVGGVDYITKPFKVVEVLARVENQLKIQQLQKELRAQNAHLRQAIQELSRLAAIDSVTQLASRKRFEEYLDQQWQQAMTQQTALTLMLCQVDGLSVDHLSGDSESDTCLYQVGRAIRQAVQRDEDFVGRYGAVIFAIALPNFAQAAAGALAERLVETFQDLEMPLPAETEHTVITLSIGYGSRVPGHQNNVSELIEGCDRALQAAVAQGGDRFIRMGSEKI